MMGKQKLQTSVLVTEDALWFSGHFPDDPVLPGVAQIKFVYDLISSHFGTDRQMKGLHRVKFKKLIKPGEQLDVQVTAADQDNQFAFQITSGSEDVCFGRISFETKDR